MLYLLYQKKDEPLLVQDAIDQIKQTMQRQNGIVRQILKLEVIETVEKALFDLRCPSLFEDSSQQSCDIFIFSPKLTEKIQKQKKITALLPPQSRIITITPVTLSQFPHWLEQRFKKAGFILSPGNKQLLCEHVEGNLLAAAQCLETLKVFYPAGGTLTKEQLEEVLISSAKYTVFDLMHYLTPNNIPKISQMLEKLQEEGIEPAIVLWGLARVCRSKQLDNLVPQLVEIDEIIKGMMPGNCWQYIKQACFLLAEGRKQ